MTTNPEGLRELVDKWEARARDAHPVDAMLINRHVRELRETLAAPINPVAVDSTVIGGAAAAGREAVIAELIEAATAAQGDGVDRVVACHGYKCRELNCASCFGEDAAAQYVDAARVRAHRLSAAIDAARASTPEADR